MGGIAAAASAAPAGSLSVRERGAAGDGATMDTKAIQAAIDACAAAGGGTVVFPPGRYLSGTIFLKSRVHLYFDSGATLLGSRNLADYPPTLCAFRSYTDEYTDKSLLYGEKLEDISLAGPGALDGQGAAFQGPYKVRPYMIRIISCRGVRVTDLTIRDSPMWVQHYLDCDEVFLRGLRVHSRVNGNNDGIDIDCSSRVTISDCEIWSGDDAIVLKSTAARPTTDVVVTNCVLSTLCNALKLGTETNGGFQNISISNCSIYDTRLAGLTLQIVDGGTLDRVTVSNLSMKNVTAPIFLRLGDRGRPYRQGDPRPGMGKWRNVVISNVQATGAGPTGCAIAGLPSHPVENCTLSNIRLSFQGGGTRRDAARAIPENPQTYPEYRMFGTLPAYGFFCRHARNLTLRDIELGFEKPDERPALVCQDVEGLTLAGASLGALEQGEPPVWLDEVRDALIQGCRVPAAVRNYLRLTGAQTARVSLLGNDFGRAGRVLEAGPEVPAGAIFTSGNRQSE